MLYLATVLVSISLMIGASSQADLLVTSLGGVHQFDDQTGALLHIWEIPIGANLVGGITVGPDGNVYVGDSATASVIHAPRSTTGWVGLLEVRRVGVGRS